jgi:GNAT superfamily N-acetyltransferase
VGAHHRGRAGGGRRPPLSSPALTVTTVPAKATHDLRRRVLREGRPDAEVHFPEDDAPETFHPAVLDAGGRVVAVATVSPAPTSSRSGAHAWRLRGMAVEPELQGLGAGTLLLDAVVARARAAGADVLWADGRDTALEFYRRRGWSVEGDGYLTPATGVPHHRVVLDLGRRR